MIWQFIIAMGVPSALMGFLVWKLKKYIDANEARQIEREKNQCNSENSQKKRDAKEEIFRAEQDMKRKNVELKKQLSMILGEQNVDSVLDGIDASEFAEDYDGGLIYGFSD